MILSSVQMAATPMVPAPMKRAFDRKTAFAIATASPAPEPEVKYGKGKLQAHVAQNDEMAIGASSAIQAANSGQPYLVPGAMSVLFYRFASFRLKPAG